MPSKVGVGYENGLRKAEEEVEGDLEWEDFGERESGIGVIVTVSSTYGSGVEVNSLTLRSILVRKI